MLKTTICANDYTDDHLTIVALCKPDLTLPSSLANDTWYKPFKKRTCFAVLSNHYHHSSLLDNSPWPSLLFRFPLGLKMAGSIGRLNMLAVSPVCPEDGTKMAENFET
jgi:hypothetical protein